MLLLLLAAVTGPADKLLLELRLFRLGFEFGIKLFLTSLESLKFIKNKIINEIVSVLSFSILITNRFR